MDKNAQIFISHARVNASYADILERILLAFDCHPWIDRQQLGGGQEWPVELQHAIETSAALLLVVTPQALQSVVVQREYRYALSLKLPVILILFEPVSSLPKELAQLPSVQYYENQIDVTQQLFFTLADRQLIPPMPTDQFDSGSFTPLYYANSNRVPSDWRVYHLSRSVHLALTFVYLAISALFIFEQYTVSNYLNGLTSYGSIQDSFVMPLVSYTCIGIGVLFLMRGYMYGGTFLKGGATRETVILTPVNCTVFITNFVRLRITPMIHTYNYQCVTQATLQCSLFGGVSVSLVDRATGQPTNIHFPWRWRNRIPLAKQIVADVATYQQQYARTDQQPIRVQTVPAKPTQTVPYSVIATNDDQATLQEMQNWLSQRGCVLMQTMYDPGNPRLLLPTATSASQSRFVLFFASPQATQSQQCQAILADLRHQGKLVIPVRTIPIASLPGGLATLQWIDFSPVVDRSRSFLDLCEALDRAGIPIALPEPQPDSELVLARALHQRTPATWHTIRSDVPAQQRIAQTSSNNPMAYVYVILPIIIFAGCLSLMSSHVDFSNISSAGVYFAALGLLYVFIFFSMYRDRLPWSRRRRFFRRVQQGFYADECIVATPTGIVVHVIDDKTSRFIDCAFAFADLRSIEQRRSVAGIPQLVLVPYAGQPITILLTYFMRDEKEIAQAVAMFAHYRSQAEVGA
jgi:TIR domain